VVTDVLESQWRNLQEASEYLRARLKTTLSIGLIIGSGLGEALGRLDGEQRFAWKDLPHFPQPTVQGHIGEFVSGRLESKEILIQRGRVHYYEGRSMDEIIFPVRVMKLLGLQTLVITNAAGAINESFGVGDFVLIKDHINMIPDNPLRGPNLDELGPRFPNLNDAYSAQLRQRARQAAESVGLSLHEGIYLATPGPMYESHAEIQAYKRLGADLVGMSTVPEVIAAAHAGLEILGISCATNLAAGVNPDATLSHTEVVETLRRKGSEMRALLLGIIARV